MVTVVVVVFFNSRRFYYKLCYLYIFWRIKIYLCVFGNIDAEIGINYLYVNFFLRAHCNVTDEKVIIGIKNEFYFWD